MKVCIDIGDTDTATTVTGRFNNQYRYRKIVAERGIKTELGFARVQIVTTVYIRPRKKQYKPKK